MPGYRTSAVVLALLAQFVATPTVRADAGETATGAVVIARVGRRTITSAELDRRMASIPPFQLRTFGQNPEEIRRNFLEKVLIRDLLFAEGAIAANVVGRPAVGDRVRGVLRGAILGQLRTTSVKNMPVTDAEIREHYEKNETKYRTPPRVALWRILLPSREAALAVLEQAKKDLSTKSWNDLAREKSIDKSTFMRGGTLGWVSPDGSTDQPGTTVDPMLVLAALQVKDGELVPEPVKEGNLFAVVWKRQSMKAMHRTLEQEAGGIRQLLMHQKTEAQVAELLARLRKESLSEHHAEFADGIEITSSSDIQQMQRPGTLPRPKHPSAGPAVPTPGSLR